MVRISLNTEYYFNLNDLKDTTLSNLNINLNNLRIKPKNGTKDVLTLKSFYVDNATVKPIAQDIHINKVTLESLHMNVKRDKKKDIERH